MRTIQVFSLAAILAPAVALAEEAGPRRLDIGIGLGYSQPRGEFGDFESSVRDVAGAGGSVQLDATYRVRPSLGVGAFGSFAQHARGVAPDGDITAYSSTAGVQAIYHLTRGRSADPWLSVGAGWRRMRLEPVGGSARVFHGLELARLQVGADVYISSGISISPVIGASLSTYLGQRVATELVAIEHRELSLTGYAGVAGHFAL